MVLSASLPVTILGIWSPFVTAVECLQLSASFFCKLSRPNLIYHVSVGIEGGNHRHMVEVGICIPLYKSQSKYCTGENIARGFMALERICQGVTSMASCKVTAECSICPNLWAKWESYSECNRYSLPLECDHLRCWIYGMVIQTIYLSPIQMPCIA